MTNSEHIRLEQEKLAEIRKEAERNAQANHEEIRARAQARIDADKTGNLDNGKANDQRQAEMHTKEREAARAALLKEQMARERQQKEDREKEDRQKTEDRQKEDLRAKTREHVKEETEKAVEKEMHEYVSRARGQVQQQQSDGPAMTPGVVNDPLKMAVAIDHPGLTDTEKAMAATAGWAVGQGWHERESERKQELMQGERAKLDGDKAHAPEKEPEKEKPAEPEKQQEKEEEREKQAEPEKQQQEKQHEPEKTPEARHDQAVKDRDDAVSNVKENVRKDHEDRQVGETGKDVKERADLESTGKVTVTQAEEMTHGQGAKDHADKQFDNWFDKHEQQELDSAGVSRDPGSYEQEQEREDEMQ